MLHKILTTESKTVSSAAFVIAATTLLSRLVGVFRDRVFAHYFGISPVMDAYYEAFKIPDLIYNLLIVGALTAGFIPTFTKLLLSDENRDAAWRLANNIINILAIILVIICGLGIIFTPFLTKIIAPGFDLETREWVNTFTRIMFISPLVLGISMVVGGILQSLRQFVIYSLAPIFYNLGIIVGAVGLTKLFGPAGLAWGVVLGALFHAGVQCVGAYKNGYRWKWILDFKDSSTRLIAKLMVPRTLGLAITQINILVTTVLASFLTKGSVAVYSYASNLQSVPNGVIGVSFALAAFPMLSNAVAKEDPAGFIEHLTKTMRQILFLIIPISVLILILRAQIVRVVLGTGAFDWTATQATFNTLAFFAMGLFAQSLIHLLARAFYALSDTKTPFVIGVISELVSIIAALLLMRPLGVAGLALAFSIGNILHALMLAIGLRSVTGSLEESKLFSILYKITIASIVMALAAQYLKNILGTLFDLSHFWEVLLQGGIAATIGLLVYGGVCYVLKVEEIIELGKSFKKRWFRLLNIQVPLDDVEVL